MRLLSTVFLFYFLSSPLVWAQQNLLLMPEEATQESTSFRYRYAVIGSRSQAVDLEASDSSLTSLLIVSMQRQNAKGTSFFGNLFLSYDAPLERRDDNNRAGNFRDLFMQVGRAAEWLPASVFGSQHVLVVASLGSSWLSQQRGRLGSLGLQYQYFLPLKKLMWLQLHRVQSNFFRTQVSGLSQSNNPFGYRFLNDLSYGLWRGLALRMSLIYDLSVSYQQVVRDAISTDFGMTYELRPGTQVFLGVESVAMSTKEADGIGNRFRVFDDRRPVAYLGWNAGF